MDTQNEHELLWQSFFALAMFISTFASYLLPIIIFSYRNGQLQVRTLNEDYMHLPNESNESLVTQDLEAEILKKRRKLRKLLSYCNCVSGGVFLGVCFLNLIPCVEDEFTRLIKDYQILKHYFGNFPLGLFSVICGLFLVLILETLLSSQFGTSFSSPSSSGQNLNGTPVNDSLDTSVRFTPPFSTEGSNVNVYVDDDSNQFEHEQMLTSSSLPLPSLEAIEHRHTHACPPNNSERDNSYKHRHSHHSHHHHHHHSQSHSSHHHGHSHMTVDMFKDKSDSMLSFFILMFATSIHSLFEGLALGLQSDISNAIRLFIGIIIHECLVAIALGLNAVRLQQNNIRLRMHIKFAFLFSLTIPVGNIFGILLGYTPGHTGRFISAIFQGLAAGTFIHVTFLELIPEELLTNTNDDDCDNDYFETIQPINNGQQSTLDDKDSRDLHSHSHSHNHDNDDYDDCCTVQSTEIHSNERSKRRGHISAKSSKMHKILLLLFGFLIMTIIPFITEE